MVNIAWPMSCGLSKREFAARVSETAVWEKHLEALGGEPERRLPH